MAERWRLLAQGSALWGVDLSVNKLGLKQEMVEHAVGHADPLTLDALSLKTGNHQDLHKARIRRLVQHFGKSEGDHGSSGVQGVPSCSA